MDILHLIDRLEELFNESKAVPLTRNVMVDEDKMLDIIDQMRIAIPEEVKEESSRIVEIARQKADELVQRDLIVVEAQRRADQIVSQARADAEATRRDADDYVVDALNHLQNELEKLTNQVRNGILMVEEDQARRAPVTPPTAEK